MYLIAQTIHTYLKLPSTDSILLIVQSLVDEIEKNRGNIYEKDSPEANTRNGFRIDSLK